QPRTTTTQLVASPGPASTFGDSVTFTATVTPSDTSLGVPTGTVVFKVDGAVQGSVPLDDQGQASITLDSLAAGTRTIRAEFSGSTLFVSSATTLTQTVRKDDTSLELVGSQSPSAVGEAVTFQATVTAGSGVPDGAVTFSVNGVPHNSAPVVDGVAQMSM